ncbi:hypothetical protein ACVIM9_008278 [Bradyrhizobium sp. USDA 4520]
MASPRSLVFSAVNRADLRAKFAKELRSDIQCDKILKASTPEPPPPARMLSVPWPWLKVLKRPAERSLASSGKSGSTKFFWPPMNFGQVVGSGSKPYRDEQSGSCGRRPDRIVPTRKTGRDHYPRTNSCPPHGGNADLDRSMHLRAAQASPRPMDACRSATVAPNPARQNASRRVQAPALSRPVRDLHPRLRLRPLGEHPPRPCATRRMPRLTARSPRRCFEKAASPSAYAPNPELTSLASCQNNKAFAR